MPAHDWLSLAALAAILALTGASLPAAAEDAGSGPVLLAAGDTPCVLDKCVEGGTPGSGPVKAAPAAGESDRDVPAPAAAPAPSRNFGGHMAPGNFDFYVLSLSWSSGFCDTGGAEKAPDQCAVGAGLGFVVHGLWPQNEHGFPADCGSTGSFPSRAALSQVHGLYPDDGLARYEWRKHGTCTGNSPTDYFADVRRAREAINIPPALQAPHEPQTWVPIDLARAFVAANPRLRTDMMAVTCVQGTLQEVRVCFTKDLRQFRTCPEVSRASCRTRQMAVPSVR